MTADALSMAQTQSSQLVESSGVTREGASGLPQLLKFQIVPSTDALLQIDQCAEVLKVPVGQVVPVPHMPTYVMGVYNWRGTVLWMLDLGLLLGMMPYQKYQGARSVHTTLVIERHDETSTLQQLGLVIHDVIDTVQVDLDALKPVELSNLPKSLTQFLSGYWMNAQGDMLAVLDDNSIFDHMPQEA